MLCSCVLLQQFDDGDSVMASNTIYHLSMLAGMHYNIQWFLQSPSMRV